MLHFFLGLIRLPRGQENVAAKSSLFERAPMDLNRPILCMSNLASVTNVLESLVSHHNLKKKKKNQMKNKLKHKIHRRNVLFFIKVRTLADDRKKI